MLIFQEDLDLDLDDDDDEWLEPKPKSILKKKQVSITNLVLATYMVNL